MSDLVLCSSCGLPLSNTAAGLCPNCLLKLGFGATETSDATGAAGTTAGLRAAAQDLAAPPTRIGPYRLLRKLGEGGMGVVYLAEQDQPIQRTVALKLIKLGMDTAEVVSRFAAERQALALMDHPNIAHVYDAGSTVDGRPYFVMEYVHGSPITDYCDAHTFTTRQRVQLFLDVCGALQHAHQKGVIHRDLKPSNILVADQDGRPVLKVIDFGIAKATDQHQTERTVFTRHGRLIGTPEYMSPEQANPARDDIDTRTDIYAMGVILYEMLVGDLPFPAERLRQAGYTELLRILREEEPPRPSRRLTPLGSTSGDADTASRRRTTLSGLASELRGDLDWITLKALEKDRTRRYASASELAADLTRSLNNEPVMARPPSTPYRLQKFVRRNQLAVGAAASIVLVVVSGLVASVTMYVRAERARHEADGQRIAAETQRGIADEQRKEASAQRQEAVQQASRADAARADADAQRSATELALGAAETNLYFNNVNLASREWAEGNVTYVDRLLRESPPRLRGWEWNVLTRLSHMYAVDIRSPGAISAMAFTPDGRRLVTAGDGVIETWEVPSGRRIGTVTYPTYLGSQGAPVLSPDGRILLSRGPLHGTAVATDTTSGKPLFSLGRKEISKAIFSPDASRIAALSTEPDPDIPYDVGMWDTRTGGSLWQRRARGISCLTFSPDGEQLALVDGTKLTLIDVATGAPGATRDVPAGTCANVVFSDNPGGRGLSYFDVGPTPRFMAVVLGPHGVLTGTFSTLPGQVRMTDAAGATLWSMPVVASATAVPTFSPNRGLLAVGLDDRLLRIVEPESGRVLRTLPGHEYPTWRSVFSADGKWLASAETLQRRVLVWSTAGWQQRSLAVDAGASFGVSRDLEPAFYKLTAPAAPSAGVRHTSPDASRVAMLQTVYIDRGNGTADGRYRVTVFDRRTGAPLRTFGLPLPPGPEITDPTALRKLKPGERVLGKKMEWSVDGRVLVVTRTDAPTDPSCHGEVWDADKGTLLHPFESAALPGFGCHTTALTPDASGLLQLLQPWDSPARRALTPRLVDLASGRVLWMASAVESFPNEFGASPVFSRDGRAVALAAFQGGIDILDMGTGTRITSLPALATSMTFSPDGRRIATVTRQGSVRLWDTANGRPLMTLPDAPGAYRTTSWTMPSASAGVQGVAFSADGRELIVLVRVENRLERRVWDGSALREEQLTMKK